MKPSELYAMPDQSVVPWYDNRGNRLEDIFGASIFDVDLDAAAEAKDRRIGIHEKMRCEWYDNNEATICAVTFDGKPYGIYQATDTDGLWKGKFLVTNRRVQAEAQQHVMSWTRQYELGDDLDEVSEITSFGVLGRYATVVKGVDGYRLVRREFVTEEGIMLFDQDSFEELFGGYRDNREAADPVIGADLRREAAELVGKCIPEGMRHVILDVLDPPETGVSGRWFAAAVATEEGTYLLGTYCAGLLRTSDLSCERIGGPELIESLERGFSPEATHPWP